MRWNHTGITSQALTFLCCFSWSCNAGILPRSNDAPGPVSSAAASPKPGFEPGPVIPPSTASTTLTSSSRTSTALGPVQTGGLARLPFGYEWGFGTGLGPEFGGNYWGGNGADEKRRSVTIVLDFLDRMKNPPVLGPWTGNTYRAIHAFIEYNYTKTDGALRLEMLTEIDETGTLRTAIVAVDRGQPPVAADAGKIPEQGLAVDAAGKHITRHIFRPALDVEWTNEQIFSRTTGKGLALDAWKVDPNVRLGGGTKATLGYKVKSYWWKLTKQAEPMGKDRSYNGANTFIERLIDLTFQGTDVEIDVETGWLFKEANMFGYIHGKPVQFPLKNIFYDVQRLEIVNPVFWSMRYRSAFDISDPSNPKLAYDGFVQVDVDPPSGAPIRTDYGPNQLSTSLNTPAVDALSGNFPKQPPEVNGGTGNSPNVAPEASTPEQGGAGKGGKSSGDSPESSSSSGFTNSKGGNPSGDSPESSGSSGSTDTQKRRHVLRPRRQSASSD